MQRATLLLVLLLTACSGTPDPLPGFVEVGTDTANPAIVTDARTCLAQQEWFEYAACCFPGAQPDSFDACRGDCCAFYAECLTRALCLEALRDCSSGHTCQDPTDPLAYYGPALAGCFQRSAEVMRRDGNACVFDMQVPK